MQNYEDMKYLEACDVRIDIGDSWIVVQNHEGHILYRGKAEIDRKPVATCRIIARIELLWSWMELHLRGIVEEHKALAVVVSPDITDEECKIIKACLSAFSPLLVWFVDIPVAAAYDHTRPQ